LVTIIICVFIGLTIILMFVVIVVFVVVVRRRHRLTGASRSRPGRRRRHRPSGGATSGAPEYDAPYVIYGAPGPNGDHQLRVVGLSDPDGVVDASALPAFNGVFVQPPPYVDEPPPAFTPVVDQTPNITRSANENHGFDGQDNRSTAT